VAERRFVLIRLRRSRCGAGAAGTGIYGILANSVAERNAGDWRARRAGRRARRSVALVLRRGLALTAVEWCWDWAGCRGSRAVASLLYGTSRWIRRLWRGAVLLLALRRGVRGAAAGAANVDPMEALRSE